MRDFILYSGKGATSSGFTLKDLPGSGGRMDLISRCVISSLWLSRKVRDDTRLHISLNGPPNPPVTIRFIGKKLERVTPDERNIALWIKKVLERTEANSEDWNEAHEGIQVSSQSFRDIVRGFGDRQTYVLHEEGGDIRESEITEDPVFILGDHEGIPERERDFLDGAGVEKISLGPESYFSSQSIAMVHNELDRRME
ncbi:MAG: tRNA (pseudouridine(54)-N(1))-methyltransferase TrmY [Candidatus Aenigmatarchaeota archaeon]